MYAGIVYLVINNSYLEKGPKWWQSKVASKEKRESEHLHKLRG